MSVASRMKGCDFGVRNGEGAKGRKTMGDMLNDTIAELVLCDLHGSHLPLIADRLQVLVGAQRFLALILSLAAVAVVVGCRILENALKMGTADVVGFGQTCDVAQDPLAEHLHLVGFDGLLLALKVVVIISAASETHIINRWRLHSAHFLTCFVLNFTKAAIFFSHHGGRCPSSEMGNSLLFQASEYSPIGTFTNCTRV